MRSTTYGQFGEAHKPRVFIGEISQLGPVYQGVCKEAVDQDVEFTISRLLWGRSPRLTRDTQTANGNPSHRRHSHPCQSHRLLRTGPLADVSCARRVYG